MTKQNGTTLVEVIVIILIIALFSMIMIADFPLIQKKFQLSRAAYKMAQDLRMALDLGLSGVKSASLDSAIPVANGYGIYIGPMSDRQYIIYADTFRAGTHTFCGLDGTNLFTYNSPCAGGLSSGDTVIGLIDLSKSEPGIFIKAILTNGHEVDGVNQVSIDFSPPGPAVYITSGTPPNPPADYQYVEIVFAISTNDTITKTVIVNKAGLIQVQ